MSAIRTCPDHGYFEGDACPDCGAPGREVLDADRRTRLSKFMSGALRHFPGDAGLDLDDAGWTAYGALVDAVERRYEWAAPEHVAAVVATDPKGRFERDGDRIRAAYGHSVDVDLETGGTPVPETLYHGTAPSNVDSILEAGLEPMDRQLVHLSGTVAAARAVGERHAADPVVLAVDAGGMLDDGYDITKRGRGVYTTDRVPPGYLSVRDR